MAIYSAVPPPPEYSSTTAAHSASHHQQQQHHHHSHHTSDASTASVDVEAWTVSALEALSVSPIARGTGHPLSIPLDDAGRSATHHHDSSAAPLKLRNVNFNVESGAAVAPPRRPPFRRDSLRRREALLKGKEGSRQRRRWENDRLLHIPNVEPPLPSDWDVHPTHPVHHVPYHLAHFWDKGLRERAEGRRAEPAAARVPRELRATAKRTPAVKGWLRDLEEPVRHFVAGRSAAVAAAASPTASDENSDEDEEIVFVGRDGSMRGEREQRRAIARSKPRSSQQGPLRSREQPEPVMVLDSLGDDESSAFKRWLTHSISDYYGLHSRSVSVGNPARRVVYIGGARHIPRGDSPSGFALPQPLWELF